MSGRIKKFGTKASRRVYSTLEPFVDIQNLYALQLESYEKFLTDGIKESFIEVSPIMASNYIEISYVDHRIDYTEIENGDMSVERALNRKENFSAPLYVKIGITDHDSGEFVEKEVFVADLPMMTESGTFIINGAERVVVSQLVMAPGFYLPKNAMFAPRIRKEEGSSINFKVINSVDKTNTLNLSMILDKIEVKDSKGKGKKVDLVSLLQFMGLPEEFLRDELQLNTDSNVETKLQIYSRLDRYFSNLKQSLNGIIENNEFDLDEANSVLEELKEMTTNNKEDISLLNKLFNDKIIQLQINKKNDKNLKYKGIDLDTFEDTKRYSKNVLDMIKSSYDRKWWQFKELGRLRVSEKLNLGQRVQQKTLAEDIINPKTNEVMLKAGERIDSTNIDIFEEAQKVGALKKVVELDKELFLSILDSSEDNIKRYKILRNIPNTSEDPEVEKVLNKINRELKVLNTIYKVSFNESDLKSEVNSYLDLLSSKKLHGKYVVEFETLKIYKDYQAQREGNVTNVIGKINRKLDDMKFSIEDIISIISFVYNSFIFDEQFTENFMFDNEDELTNKTVKGVGYLLKNEFKIGLHRINKNFKVNPVNAKSENFELKNVPFNQKTVSSVIKSFFGSDQLSQYMDQVNPLAELTHKRRLSSLGKGGVGKNDNRKEIRDITGSYYGRICPIETPEGFNIGIINTLAIYAKIDRYGLIEAPVIEVEQGKVKPSKKPIYLSASKERINYVAQATQAVDEEGNITEDILPARYKGDATFAEKADIRYRDFLPQQPFSVSTSLIPFLSSDDANRALMGSNMQRQAVPLIKPDSPIVGTGIEYLAGKYSGAAILAKESGTVVYVDAKKIQVETKEEELHTYLLRKFFRTNQGTSQNHQPIVKVGEKVLKGSVLADSYSMQNGELALGQNPLIAFMTWEGYNFEDAVIISERLVKDDVYTSVHLEAYEVKCRETRLGNEEFTKEIPSLGEDQTANLDDHGIVKVGSKVQSGSILVGKVTPKGSVELSSEEKLLQAIFGEKSKEVRDTSLRLPNSGDGIVQKVVVLSKEDGDKLESDVTKFVRIYVAQKRKIKVGDKMAGRHGNKGVVSKIVPEEDMPHLEDGTPIDIMLSPMGVPSRMNIGQILETHLGMAGRKLGIKMATPVFDGANDKDLIETMDEVGIPRSGKFDLIDGRTGEKFMNPVTVGVMYFMKLNHLVDDKMHARSIGPYSIITQQPLGGKAQFGGQRLGEMEVWAIEAYGSANVLRELMTLKSDDVEGRAKMYDAIINDKEFDEFNLPEAFNVMKKEFQSLGLDIELDIENERVVPSEETELEYYEDNEVEISNFNFEDFDASEFIKNEENYNKED